MSSISLFFQIIEGFVFLYLIIAAAYILLFSIAGRLSRRPAAFEEAQIMRQFAILIPAYKEDAVILDVARKALEQQYPKDRFEVVIIADSFRKNTLEKLHEMPLKVIEVRFENRTKAKALNKAMSQLGDHYHVALVLDADNIMEPGLLRKINNAFERGDRVVQAHRIAKNTNTALATLDAISEEINNHIFRKGHRALGLSSALIGSGMAFQYQQFKRMMGKIKAVGGFDKELELTLLKNKIKIQFLEHAYVWDEKVQHSKAFQKQRKRWLSSQLFYFKKFFGQGVSQLFVDRNMDFVCKWYQMIQPPRVLLLGALAVITLITGVAGQGTTIPFYFWLAALAMAITAMLLAMPGWAFSRKTLMALSKLPVVIWGFIKILFTMKGSNKTFIHTKHGEDHQP